MLRLYQFPISHYCEKIRWSLDYKGIDYEIKNLLPGLHSLKTTKLAKQSSVPIVVDGSEVIQGSDNIISYLDNKYPGKNLTPESSELREQALEWEKYVDTEIGIHVRRCCYHVLLEHPDIVISFFSQDGPWYARFLMKRMFPKLKSTMQQGMNITDESALDSRKRMGLAVDKLHAHMQDNSYLVGEQFSRADLAAASLLAPLCMPDKYGLLWPENVPADLRKLISEFESRITWVDRLYKEHR